MLTTGLRTEDYQANVHHHIYITADEHSTVLRQLGLHEDDKNSNFYHYTAIYFQEKYTKVFT